MKILLLNPPGKKLYVRDYYCSSTSKASYLFQPLDLINMSGLLSKEHEVLAHDAILKRESPSECLKTIKKINPEVIVSMTGSVSWDEDQVFFSSIKSLLPGVILILNGDVFFDHPENFIETNSFIDGITLDFVTDHINTYLRGDFENLTNFVYRTGPFSAKKTPEKISKNISLGLPRHELFLDTGYTFPFARSHPFATLLTNYGCPWKCQFCIAAEMAFRWRPLEEIETELDKLHTLGVKELFIKDYTFGLPKKNAKALLELMVKKFQFSWTCYSRVDVLDEELMVLMKKSGCHTIIFGVESGSNRILKAQIKGFKRSQVVKGFRLARKVGIETVATFVLGLPQDDQESILKTIRFARYIDCDYASFNVAVPRTGTPMRKEAIKEGLIESSNVSFDHSGQEIAMETQFLSLKSLGKLRTRAILEFYFRVKYIFQRAKKITSIHQLRVQAQMALALWKSA